MTTIDTSIGQVPVRLDLEAHAPAFSKAMNDLDRAATKQLDKVAFDPRLPSWCASGRPN